jgi:hypothetical protein
MRVDRLAERSRRDELDEAEAATAESPSDRLALVLELSDLTRDLAVSASVAWLDTQSDLSEKARLYVTPLLEAARVVR